MASQIAEMERQLEDEKVALMEARRSLSEIRKHKEEVNNKLNLYGKNCRRLESNKVGGDRAASFPCSASRACCCHRPLHFA